ncbi:unnamed protein product [Didymodactylos carnosus]|uniref:protein disulfide-isomerase n=1 Tax=Didymodactylos carnosus TaxID=1234261 RepID=A0A813YDJ0_9BILA|nr:unnamed protein product [Didymodactylos carnosus]CAF0882712.1 unnamed protein product [Didymodactylos carnosus]CAF3647074.1 unnamed protein product [Didymodactylos carnosus]CAF3668583.1 unnamed protein product [Didymodactylos carnosus]
MICLRSLIILFVVFSVIFSEESLSDPEQTVNNNDLERKPLGEEVLYHEQPMILDGPSLVVALSNDNFTQFIESHPVVLVEFYAPWCEHCKQLEPNYETAARLMKDNEHPVQFAKVNSAVESSLVQQYDVEKYPTLKIFHHQNPYPYDGPLGTGHSIMEYMKQYADPDWRPPLSDVFILTAENFTQFTENEPLSLVEFYTPLCKMCKNLELHYEKAARHLKRKNIKLAKVDATQEVQLAKEHNITEYPTLFVFLQGGKKSLYNGKNTERTIVQYMEDMQLFPSQELNTSNEYKELFTHHDKVYVIGLFTNKNTPLYNQFMDYANFNRRLYKFSHTFHSTDILPLNDIKTLPAIVIQYHPDIRSKYENEKYVLAKTSATLDDIKEFVEKHQTPLVGLLTQDSLQKFYDKLRPLCVIFYDVSFSFDQREQTQYWRQKVLNVAKDYKNKIIFAITDEEKMENMLTEFDLDYSSEDVNVGCYSNDGMKYRLDDDDEFTSDSFREFIEKFDKGKLKPYIRSQTMPKKAIVDGIMTIVGKNFEQIVNDKTKDVVIFFHTSWCMLCKSFLPTYNQIAQSYKGSKNLLFTQFDATANDLPTKVYDISTYPTLYIVPSNNKLKPIKYNGNRDTDDFKKFVETYSTNIAHNKSQEL